ncbi:MAG: FKBP-type peptidyl-prolyl cis-trans isomerase [Cyanobacteria bacterium P01_G01_bin.54]
MRVIGILLVSAGLLLGACSAEPGSTEDATAEAANEPDAKAETVTTDSGLQYIDLMVGEGESPEPGDIVEVHYHGTLEDGTVFDSSVERDMPFQFQIGVGQVIPGWDEGVGSMQIGGKRKLIIPPDLAYGDAELGPIPANSTLIFEVELLDLLKQ